MATARQGCRPRKRRMSSGTGILVLVLQMMIYGGCLEEKQSESPVPQLIVRMKIPARPGPAITPSLGGGPASETKPGSALLETAQDERPGPAGLENAQGFIAGSVESEIRDGHGAAEKEDRIKPPPREGVYRVRRGDTLAGIAARKEVYGNPLKWTCLYRLNMEELKRLGAGESLPNGPLPDGMDLTYATAGQASQRGRRPGRPVWVVNVISSKAPDEIVPVALQLMEVGYGVYIARAEVRGEEWMRLRVGFFRDRKQAAAAAEELSRAINSKGPWVAKADDDEIRRFACY